MRGDEFVIVCGSVSVFFMIFAFVLAMRYIAYRETVFLAERGLTRGHLRDGKGSLRWGILISAVGLALCLGLWPLGLSNAMRAEFPLGLGPWMLIGLVPLFFGLALVLIYFLTAREERPAAPPPARPPEAEPKA